MIKKHLNIIRYKNLSLYQESYFFIAAQGKHIPLKCVLKVFKLYACLQMPIRISILCTRIHLQNVSAGIFCHILEDTKKKY
jgi:hypothetical protein